jgi:putative ABC transport system permease protein
MTIAGFIARNALRNKRRLFLTVLSVAISLFLFTAIVSVLRALTSPEESDDSAQRIIVRHRVSLGNVLPVKYQERIMHMPGIAACSKFTWFGGIYKDEKNFFPQFAVDADQIFKILSEAKVDPKQLDDYIKERTACIVGKATMERFNWKIGDRITLRGTIWGCDPELVIRGMYEGSVDESNMFFHHDYFDELMGRLNLCGTFWIKTKQGTDIAALMQRIDDAFKNTDAETKTETERAFVLNFVSMQGNIKTLLGSICAVIVFTMILVTASTMSMSIRERSREIAILKAIGYDGGRLFGLILAESTVLSLIGGAIGVAGGWSLSQMNMGKYTNGAIPKLIIPGEIIATGILIAFALGVIACLAPAYTTLRTTIVSGLKELD